MLPKSQYTIGQIRKAWVKYRKTYVLRVLKDGVWKTYDLKKGFIGNIQGTRAEKVHIFKVIGFPEFLEKQE